MGKTPLRNPLVLVLAGALLGLVVGAGLGAGVWLLLSGAPETMAVAPVPETYDIEAAVTEDYINRVMVESANDMAGAVSIVEGHLDLRPGSVADFVVRLKVGPLQPIVEGTVGFRATDDREGIEILVLDARFGRLRLNRLVPTGVLDGVNADIRRMLVDRVGSQGLEILDVVTDEDSLRLHLGRAG